MLRELRPEVVLGHDPWKRYRLHPDHHHAGLLACEGIVASRDPHFFPEQGLAPHRPVALLLWEADEPDHAEDVSGFVDAKLAALEAHASQFESTMKATDELQLEAFRKRVRERLADHGAPHRRGRGRAVPRPSTDLWAGKDGRTSPPARSRQTRVRANCPGRRPGPGGPAKAWAMPIHSSAAVPRRPARCRPGAVAA